MLNFNKHFQGVLYIILLIKLVVAFLYLMCKDGFINYSALFYEDGYFNPFIAEKNVMDFEDQKETEIEVNVPRYVKRAKIGGVYNIAQFEDYMTSRGLDSPRKSVKSISPRK